MVRRRHHCGRRPSRRRGRLAPATATSRTGLLDSGIAGCNWRHLGPLSLPGPALRLRHAQLQLALPARGKRSAPISAPPLPSMESRSTFASAVASHRPPGRAGVPAWTVEAQTNEGDTRYSCGFLYLCTGYYDYDASYQPEFGGLGEFCGSFVAPQFWPSDLNYVDRDVVVIGSGATAVTLAPALARAGAQVTMLQRSPSYIAALPSIGFRPWIGRLLPQRASYHHRRLHSILGQQIFWEYCRRRPARAIVGAMIRQIVLDPATGRDVTSRGGIAVCGRQGAAHFFGGTARAGARCSGGLRRICRLDAGVPGGRPGTGPG
jgi:hypothetical protein